MACSMGMVVAARLTGFRGGREEATMSAGKIDEDRRKQIESDCVSEAWKIGAKSAATALGLAGAAVGGANYFFHGFRTSLGVSGKAALVVSLIYVPFKTSDACMQAGTVLYKCKWSLS